MWKTLTSLKRGVFFVFFHTPPPLYTLHVCNLQDESDQRTTIMKFYVVRIKQSRAVNKKCGCGCGMKHVLLILTVQLFSKEGVLNIREENEITYGSNDMKL